MRVRTSRRFSASAAILSGVLAIVASDSFARTWYIKADGSGDAPTIQAGVDSALAGDVVLVAAGTYSATSTVTIDGTPTVVCVSIGKNIKLQSESGAATTTISSAAATVGIYVHDVDSTAEIRGFKIQTQFEHWGCVLARSPDTPQLTPPSEKDGIKCRNGSPIIAANEITLNGGGIALVSSPAQVIGNTISSALYGVGCLEGSDALVSNNTVYDCGNGVRSQNSSPRIDNNQLSGGCAGVSLSGTGTPVIANNYVHDTLNCGINCESTSMTLENNRIVSTGLAVLMNGLTGTAIIRGNIFYHQFGAFSLSGGTGSITIEANTIDLATGALAISCQVGSSPIIRRNIITRAGAGISCDPFSFPIFECNNVFLNQSRYIGHCSDQTGINGNISVDPQFCGVADSQNYWLKASSPCAPGNHPNGANCGRIGAKDVGCTVIVGAGPLAQTTGLVSVVPNPFNPQTTITYSLALQSKVEINIYDVSGKVIRELVSGVQSLGPHSVVWQGTDMNGDAVASGVYFARMEVGGQTSTMKMILLK